MPRSADRALYGKQPQPGIPWMLEELGAEHRVMHYERDPSWLAPSSLKSVHRLGKSPVVVSNGLVAESGVIMGSPRNSWAACVHRF